jgi:hypothetical protein
MPSDGSEKALTTNCDHGKEREARIARFAGLGRFRSDRVVVIWSPNQIFENRKKKGRDPEGNRPFAFSYVHS